MTTLQKVYTTLGIIVISATIVSGVDTFILKNRFADKATEAKVEELDQVLAGTAQYVEKIDLRSEYKFIRFQLDRLEDDYRDKPKDLYYHDKKRTLERQLKDVEELLKGLKEK